MKFIHTADLHIDQPFSGINSDEGVIKETFKKAKEQVLSSIVDVCIENKVDFLLVVGDTFHRNQPSLHTQRMVIEQFERLAKEGIKVVMSFGNHDYYTANRYWFDWPENVILFKDEKVQTKTLHLKNGESVSISGFSYNHLWIEQSMLPQFPKKQSESTYHIGFYHGDNSKRYAPFSLSELPQNYDYWALGHIHKSEIISERPFVAYPGTPQGHNKKETQTKGVLLVELEHIEPKVEWVDVASVKWYQEEIEIKEEQSKLLVLKDIESFLTAKTYRARLNIVSLTLKTTSDKRNELLHEKEELLLYLQEMIFKKSNKTIWLKELTFTKDQTEKLIMGFDASLIDDLSKKYETRQSFDYVVEDLIKHASISNNLTWDKEEIEQLVGESSQLVKDKMIFKDEENK